MATSATATCPECGTVANQSIDGTEVVCPECAIVVNADPIDHGPDWRSFSDDDHNPERAAPGNRNRSDRGLGSEIAHQGRDHALERQSQYHKQAQMDTTKDRNRDYATSEVRRVAAGVAVSESLIEQAQALFRQLHEADELHGRDLDTVAAACVLAVCRVHQRGRTAADIARHARSEARMIARRYRWVMQTLGLETPPPDPEQRIRVVAGRVGMAQTAVHRAIELCRALSDHERRRGKPSTLAAACCYRAGDVTQRAVAEAADCTPAAVRNRLGAVRALEGV